MTNIKSVKIIPSDCTYDLEVDHPDHQFYLANGVLTSNSHSILYSMISYKTAYLKAHYPIEFLLANLMAEVKSASPDAKPNIDRIKKEIRSHKVKILPPDINKSQLTYTILSANELITGLDALKFVSDEAVGDIISKRPFKDFFDFMVRVDSRKVRSNTIQALASAGCLSSFGLSRKTIYLYCSDYRKKLQIWLKKHDPQTETFTYPWVKEEDWSISEYYALEQYYLNESFICKPAKAYGNFFADDHKTARDVLRSENKAWVEPIKAIVRDFFEFKVKKENSKFYGKSMVKAVLEDKNGEQISCTIFPDRWEELQKRIKQINSKCVFEAGLAISFAGTANMYEDNMGIIINKLYDLHRAPSLPADLKAKKVTLKKNKEISGATENPNDISGLAEEIEDGLYDEGLIDLDLEDN